MVADEEWPRRGTKEDRPYGPNGLAAWHRWEYWFGKRIITAELYDALVVLLLQDAHVLAVFRSVHDAAGAFGVIGGQGVEFRQPEGFRVSLFHIRFLGRPPFFPFSRDAFCFAGVDVLPMALAARFGGSGVLHLGQRMTGLGIDVAGLQHVGQAIRRSLDDAAGHDVDVRGVGDGAELHRRGARLVDEVFERDAGEVRSKIVPQS